MTPSSLAYRTAAVGRRQGVKDVRGGERAFRFARGLLWLAFLGRAALACERGDDSAPAQRAASQTAFARGDSVLVQQADTLFAVGRVVATGGQQLEVQLDRDGQALRVGHGEVYRLPQHAPTPGVGDRAVCRREATEWQPCRVVRGDGLSYEVEWLDGGRHRTLPRGELVLPSEMTDLNLARAFQVVEKTQAFQRAAERAGEPRPPAGWRPDVGEPVVARDDGSSAPVWRSARVLGVVVGDAGTGVQIEWSNRGGRRTLPRDAVVPWPPHRGVTLAPGQYALLPPTSPGGSWRAVRVVAGSGDDVTVVDALGARQRVEVRKVVPSTAP